MSKAKQHFAFSRDTHDPNRSPDGSQAVMLFSTARALREGLGAPLPPVDRAAYDSAVAACRAQLGEAAFAEAWTQAAARPFQEVVEEVLKLRQNWLGS